MRAKIRLWLFVVCFVVMMVVMWGMLFFLVQRTHERRALHQQSQVTLVLERRQG